MFIKPDDPTDLTKGIPVKNLINLLTKFPPDHILIINKVGNLGIYAPNLQQVGYIDLAEEIFEKF